MQMQKYCYPGRAGMTVIMLKDEFRQAVEYYSILAKYYIIHTNPALAVDLLYNSSIPETQNGKRK